MKECSSEYKRKSVHRHKIEQTCKKRNHKAGCTCKLEKYRRLRYFFCLSSDNFYIEYHYNNCCNCCQNVGVRGKKSEYLCRTFNKSAFREKIRNNYTCCYRRNKKIYNELFNTLESKAKAFDTIAEKYYFSNFGSISRSDFDTLMFSLYIEQILFKHQDDFSAYSDYTLSKQLGITQTKVSNLKVKKQCQTKLLKEFLRRRFMKAER